jgi:hypothetical protein
MAATGSSSALQSQQDNVVHAYDCSSLLAHVTHEEAKIGSLSGDEMAHFGHPPAPQVCLFRLTSKDSALEVEAPVLVVAYTRRCVSAQVVKRKQPQAETSATCQPFPIFHFVPEVAQPAEQQQTSAPEEEITALTMVALEDLSLVSVAESVSQVVFDDNPQKRRVQFDEATPLESTASDISDGSTARGKNLQLRGTVLTDQKIYLPRVAIIFGTNLSRVLAVEIRWNPSATKLNAVVVAPLSEPLELLPLDPLHLFKKIQEEKQVPFCPMGGVNHMSTFVMVKQQSEHQYAIASAATKKEASQPTTPTNSSSLPQQQQQPMAYVWISYGDGTIVRLHHAAFFRSVVGEIRFSEDDILEEENSIADGGEITYTPTVSAQVPTLAERFRKRHISLLLRCQTKFPKKDTSSFCIIPLPKYHPSPLAPLLPFKTPTISHDNNISNNKTDVKKEEDASLKETQDDNDDNATLEVCEALLFAKHAAGSENFPTFCFYTSEDQFVGRIAGHTAGVDPALSTSSLLADAPILGTVLGGTKAVVGGVLGALTWGLGGGSTPKAAAATTAATADHHVEGKSHRHKKMATPAGYFPSLRNSQGILHLFAGYELHDAPRQVESVTIDPEGNLAASTDSFGRVMLIDLSTKQVIRMWKGFREASCEWLQVPLPSPLSAGVAAQQQPTKKSLFLVIHSRQRRVVEVYRVRHGPRVKSIQVGRDAKILSCKELLLPSTASTDSASSGDYLSSCYIVHSTVPGTATPQVMEKIQVHEHDGSVAREELQKAATNNPQQAASTNPKEAALRLQRLQQLLANTNVPCQLQDVHAALLQIKSLKDLATCLDRLAVASVLEAKMGVTGTEFQKSALAYCRESLKDAVKNATGDPATNPSVKLLATKIVYHTQVIDYLNLTEWVDFYLALHIGDIILL